RHRQHINNYFPYTTLFRSYAQSLIWYNVGEVVSKGIELQLSGTPIRNDNVTWQIDFTGNYQQNKLTKLSSDMFQSDFIEFGGLRSEEHTSELQSRENLVWR